MLQVRNFKRGEVEELMDALQNDDGFARRRALIILASASGARATRIAEKLGCSHGTVRDAIRAFNSRGLESLIPSKREGMTEFSRNSEKLLRRVLSAPPDSYGQKLSRWTLEGLADACFSLGITSRRISREGMRQAVNRLGLSAYFDGRDGRGRPAQMPPRTTVELDSALAN